MSGGKLCPIMSKPVAVDYSEGESEVVPIVQECAGSKCQFWVTACTTENYSYQNCAYVISALKNSDGKIPV